MSRLYSDNDIFTLIRDLERQSNEIKNSQIVGSDAVRTHKISTSNIWDRDVTVSSSWTGGITQNFTIRYTPDNPLDKPPAAFQVATTQLVTGDYTWVNTLKARVSIRRKKVTDPLIQEWAVSVLYNDGYGVPIRYRLKFWVMATGRGTITIV